MYKYSTTAVILLILIVASLCYFRVPFNIVFITLWVLAYSYNFIFLFIMFIKKKKNEKEPYSMGKIIRYGVGLIISIPVVIFLQRLLANLV